MADAEPIIDGSGVDTSSAAGDSCASATAITAGSLPGQTTVGYVNDYQSGTCTFFSQDGPDRVYSIDVAAGMVLTATVTPDAAFDASIVIVGSLANCTAPDPTCADGVDQGYDADPEVAHFRNGTAGTQTVYIIVDSDLETGGAFTLDTAIAAAPATGDTCMAPEVITAGTLTAHTTVGYTDDLNDRDGSCAGYPTTGPDRVYAITVPGLNRLEATMTPAALDLGLFLISPLASCTADPTCIDASDLDGVGLTETASWLNQSATPAEVFVSIDSYYAVAAGAYDLTTALTPAAMGEVCANAIPATATQTGSTSAATGEYDAMTSCTGYATSGPDVVYTAIIPSGQTLTATVTPTSSGSPDPALYILAMDGCTAAPACLDGSDGVDVDPAETVTHMNAGAAPLTVFIVVDTFYGGGDPRGIFDYTLTTSSI